MSIPAQLEAGEGFQDDPALVDPARAAAALTMPYSPETL